MSKNELMDVSDSESEGGEIEVFNPKKHKIPDGSVLEMDESSYRVFHNLSVEYSCLSFDIITDNLGSGAERADKYPYSLYAVAGSQAIPGKDDILTILKMSNIHKIKGNDESDDDEEDDEENLDNKPEIEHVNIFHAGNVNRLKFTQVNDTNLAATFSSMSVVNIFDITPQIEAVSDASKMSQYLESKPSYMPLPLYASQHKEEGYALDWSSLNPGHLISGDNRGEIYLTTPNESEFTTTSYFYGHQGSVEDLQWGFTQPYVFLSCSSDRSLCVWDTRNQKTCIKVNNAHDSDINVIAWNGICRYTLASGGDDGLIKLWDMRMFSVSDWASNNKAVTHVFDYHKNHAITSLDWCPESEHVFAAGSEDDMVTLWDTAMEEGDADQDEDGIPVQLLFNHMGQTEIKEVHWHKQIPGLIMSTGLEGLNLFRTISV